MRLVLILFIVSTLAIFATIGFSSFALYMAIFLAAVIALFGVLGAVIVASVTYIAWGSVFAMEVLLYDTGTTSAKEWFVSKYKFKLYNFTINFSLQRLTEFHKLTSRSDI